VADPHGDLPPGLVTVDDLERARCVAETDPACVPGPLSCP